MIQWLAAIAVGLALAAFSYGRPSNAVLGLAFALRTLSVTLVGALALNAPTGPLRRAAPWVALDASASWRAAAGADLWRAARASADSLMDSGADSLVLFGDSLRSGDAPGLPSDGASNVGALVDAARAGGRPMLIVTDGRLDNVQRLAELPAGSAVLVMTASAPADAGVAALDAPTFLLGGDTIEVRALVRAGASGSAAVALSVQLGAQSLANAALPALEPFAEHDARLRIVVPAVDGRFDLRAVLSAGDAVAMNDTAAVAVEVSGSAAAVLVSTSPDQDARFALAVLRGTRRGAIRGYWRVAPGQWRSDDGLRPVDESVVRRAIGEAALVVLHGDTAYFGAPLARTRGALVLLAGPAEGEEFYATAAGDSPLRAAIAELPWDSLPPLRVSPTSAGTGFNALLTHRARRVEERPAVVLRDGVRRVALVPASGFWRWRTRGGRAADAYDALWGSIFDWVGAARRTEGSAAAGARTATEWVPRAPTVVSGPVGTGSALDLTPRSRELWWLAVLAVFALCVEWILRRRIGWR